MGKLGLALVGKVMLSKSLTQFSADGWGCVPSLYFGQTMVGVMAVMVTSFKRACSSMLRSQDCCSLAPDPTAGPCQHTPPQRLLDTHRQVGLRLVWGHCSFSLGPGVHKILLCPPTLCFPSPVEVL